MKMIKSAKIIIYITLIVAMASVSFPMSAFAEEIAAAQYGGFAYHHDPMKNPKAAADIIKDDNAVYGYRPNPESKRLGVFASYDWTDPAVVSEMRKEREDYHESIKELYSMISRMRSAGSSTEEIARAVSTRRNEIRLEQCKTEEELAKTKKSNLDTYGNENGGTPEYFYQKYGSWETVIEKSLSTNAGADACLGLYDTYYDTYFFEGKGEVDKINVDSVSISGLSHKIAVGKKLQLTAEVLPAYASDKTVKWTSSNTKIATVTETGLVKIRKKAKGKSFTVTAAAADGSGKKASWKIKVMKGCVKKITIKGKRSVKAGKKLKLKVKVKTSKGRPVNKKVRWTSSNTEYAVVSQSGVVRAQEAGKGKTVKIKVMATDGSGVKKSVKIRIK